MMPQVARNARSGSTQARRSTQKDERITAVRDGRVGGLPRREGRASLSPRADMRTRPLRVPSLITSTSATTVSSGVDLAVAVVPCQLEKLKQIRRGRGFHPEQRDYLWLSLRTTVISTDGHVLKSARRARLSAVRPTVQRGPCDDVRSRLLSVACLASAVRWSTSAT